MPLPGPRGLYHPSFEHDACGTGFVADLCRQPSHRIVELGLEVLARMSHRGACGADPLTGDGAGILLQIPHVFYERAMARKGKELPNAGDYGVAQAFLSQDPDRRAVQMRTLEDAVRYHNQKVIGWRDVPVEPGLLGPLGRKSQPVFRQLFIARMCQAEVFERTLFMIRKRAGRLASITGDFYIASCSSRTVVYKGLALPERLGGFYPDLNEDDVRTSLALVHSRFSTNTFPTWERAHPYRYLAHNGEIDTLRGNQTWMAAREPLLASDAFAEHLSDFTPIIRPNGSDSASLDNVVDFLVAGGRSLPHVMMMLVPEAWSTQPDMDPDRRAFYEYHGGLVEPWDGPAAILFTDGVQVGAMLDRNGLRPGKVVVTRRRPRRLRERARRARHRAGEREGEDAPLAGQDAARRHEGGARRPRRGGEAEGRDAAAVRRVGAREQGGDRQGPREPGPVCRHDRRHARGRDAAVVPLLAHGRRAPARGPRVRLHARGPARPARADGDRRRGAHRQHGQRRAARDPVAPPAASSSATSSSSSPRSTNPPIDPIRESSVMSLVSCVGGEKNLLGETPEQARLLELPHPILTQADLAQIKGESPLLRVATLPIFFAAQGTPPPRCRRRSTRWARPQPGAVDEGASILVLSDRGLDPSRAPSRASSPWPRCRPR